MVAEPSVEIALRQRFAYACFAALLCLAPAAAGALECREIPFRDIHATVCRVDIRTDHLQLFLNDPAGKPLNTFTRLAESLSSRGQRLEFAMNAGMYREDYSPLGLFVADGHEVHRMNLASARYGNFYIKPNGVFVVTATGARLVASPDYASIKEPVRLATQSGPLLVQAGTINSFFDPQGTSKYIRNGVGLVNSNEVIFAITTEAVNFYTFAALFRDELKCNDALYLDGSISSLYVRSLDRNDEWAALGPMIGVTVPAASAK
jgi:uncharacterized protein YigE (DUF2233 family)